MIRSDFGRRERGRVYKPDNTKRNAADYSRKIQYAMFKLLLTVGIYISVPDWVFRHPQHCL